MHSFLDRLHAFFLGLHRNIILVIVLGSVAILGWLDYGTGFEITFSFFYLLPILIATWYIDLKTGRLMTVLSIVIWTVSNWLAGESYSTEIVRYWNAFIRFMVFYSISTLMDQFKTLLRAERQLARIDHLTGITNSREFYTQAELEIKRASRYAQPLSIAYLDLDHFKEVNDQKGHQEGDRVLQAVAQAVLGQIRKTDVFARLGGDEFALLLPNTDQAAVKVVLDKMEKSVTDTMKAMKSPVTMSVGAVTFTSPPESVDELIHKADELMYKAKMSGKNRMYFA